MGKKKDRVKERKDLPPVKSGREIPVGRGGTVDRRGTRMRFRIRFDQPGLPSGVHELVADGETVVQREAARKVKGDRFRIPAHILDMSHKGEHSVLGPFEVNVDPARSSQGAIEGSRDPETGRPRIDDRNPAQSFFDVHFQITTSHGTFVTGDRPFRVLNPKVADPVPGASYINDIRQLSPEPIPVEPAPGFRAVRGKGRRA